MYCPLSICRNAVLRLEEGERIAQCSFGSEIEGSEKFKLGNSGRFGDVFGPDIDFDEGCCW